MNKSREKSFASNSEITNENLYTKLLLIHIDIGEMKGDIGEMKNDIGEMKGDIGEMKNDIGEMKGDIKTISTNISKLVDIFSKSFFPKKQIIVKKPLKIKMKNIFNLNEGSSDSSNSRRSKSFDK